MDNERNTIDHAPQGQAYNLDQSPEFREWWKRYEETTDDYTWWEMVVAAWNAGRASRDGEVERMFDESIVDSETTIKLLDEYKRFTARVKELEKVAIKAGCNDLFCKEFHRNCIQCIEWARKALGEE